MSEQELRRFSGSAPENYERYFVPTIGRPMAEELLGRAKLHTGERVLDVACGTGIIARLAQKHLGPGRITGIDVTPEMVEVARSVTPSEMGITWREANAESIPFTDASFDVVFCGLGLQFMNRVTALKEMNRVLVPGGRLFVSTPGRMPAPFEIIEAAIARYIAPEAAGFMRAVFSLHDPAELVTFMSEAGLKQVRVEPGMKRLRMPAPQDFVWQYVHSTPLAPAVTKVDASKRHAMEQELVEKLDRFTEEGHLIMDIETLFATARK